MAYNYRENQTYLQVVKSAETVLSAGHKDKSSALSAKNLIGKIREHHSVDLGDQSILSYLSYAANHDTLTKIDSGGPRGGYWYNTDFQPSNSDEPAQSVSVSPREAHLYELIRYWLQAKKGFRAKDISQLKAGGIWGNPDVVGITSTDRLGLFDVEIVSAEVKLSEKEWRRFIFEAVSHKRFANRVYYIFRTRTETFKLPDEMDRYAEQYRIGIIQVPLNDEELGRLGNSDDKANFPDYADRIIERVPAVYDFVPPRYQIDFLERIGLKQREDVIRFGLVE